MNASADAEQNARERAASVWQARRYAELEAAARFDGLSAKLARHGASEGVCAMAQRAARDELRHAELCARLVEHFGARPAPAVVSAPGARPVAPAGFSERDALLYELVALSCVTETLSTALLGARVEAARDSFAKTTMHSILCDEVQHSRLGWAYLAEARSAGTPDVVGAHLPAMFSATFTAALFDPAPPDPLDGLLSAYGALDRAAILRVTRDCFETVVFPGLERFGVDTSHGRRWLESKLGPESARPRAP